MSENMKVEKQGNTLTIKVQLDAKGRPSSTGKSTILFTSHGYAWMHALHIPGPMIARSGLIKTF